MQRNAVPLLSPLLAQVSLLSVDDMYQNLPPTEQDLYWDEARPQPPYTVATAAESQRPSFMGSTFNLRMSDDPEQCLQVEASRRFDLPAPVTQTSQTPLLGRFLAARAPSPAVSLQNLRTSHLLHLRPGGEEAEGRIEEAVDEGSENEAMEP